MPGNKQKAGIALEVVKDLLYEAYVRKGKLQQAMMVRRFFLDETSNRLRSLAGASPRTDTATTD